MPCIFRFYGGIPLGSGRKEERVEEVWEEGKKRTFLKGAVSE